MAFCGPDDISDEKKEDFKVMDHSLNKVCAFSTVKKQVCVLSKEGLLQRMPGMVDEFLDRRIKVDYGKRKFRFDSFTGMQVKARLRSGKAAVGSGCPVKVNGEWHLLTCAHNLCAMSPYHKKLMVYSDVYVYNIRNGEDKWYKLYRVVGDRIRVHPNYNDDPSCGFDIAVSPLEPVDHFYNKSVRWKFTEDSIWSAARPKSLKAGMKIEICGYPAEMKGYPYYHFGEIVDVKKQAKGGWTLFYDLDSSPGMSGSPISIIDEKWLADNLNDNWKSNGVKKATIGVHTGHDDTVMLNYGSLITPALGKWIVKSKKVKTGRFGFEWISRSGSLRISGSESSLKELI